MYVQHQYLRGREA